MTKEEEQLRRGRAQANHVSQSSSSSPPWSAWPAPGIGYQASNRYTTTTTVLLPPALPTASGAEQDLAADRRPGEQSNGLALPSAARSPTSIATAASTATTITGRSTCAIPKVTRTSSPATPADSGHDGQERGHLATGAPETRLNSQPWNGTAVIEEADHHDSPEQGLPPGPGR